MCKIWSEFRNIISIDPLYSTTLRLSSKNIKKYIFCDGDTVLFDVSCNFAKGFIENWT